MANLTTNENVLLSKIYYILYIPVVGIKRYSLCRSMLHLQLQHVVLTIMFHAYNYASLLISSLHLHFLYSITRGRFPSPGSAFSRQWHSRCCFSWPLQIRQISQENQQIQKIELHLFYSRTSWSRCFSSKSLVYWMLRRQDRRTTSG